MSDCPTTPRWLACLALSLILACFAILLANPIWDADFWWHVAAGRWIWEHHTLPGDDPFGVFTNANPIRLSTVLQGQWLGQLTLYQLYESGGANAVAFTRSALLTATLWLAWQRMRPHTSAPLALALLAVAGFCLTAFTGDRPQLFSIAFAALLGWILDQAERHRQPAYYLALPVIGVAWANSHGGVILGLMVLLGYTLTGFAQAWRGDGRPSALQRHLGLAVVAFAATTLLTPNGLDTYRYLFDLQGSELQNRTSEYVSTLRLFQHGHYGLQAWSAIVLLGALLSLPALLRSDPRHAVLTFGLLALSLESFRYLVFLLVIALPYIGTGLSSQLTKGHTRPPSPFTATASLLLPALLTLLLAATLYQPGSRGGIHPERYPQRLAAVLQQQNGRVFNWMRWGGYLLWQAPKLTPFIDGRMLDDGLLVAYTHILWATPQGKRWLDEGRFNWVLIPLASPSGETYALHRHLQRHPGWRLATHNQEGYLYQRR